MLSFEIKQLEAVFFPWKVILTSPDLVSSSLTSPANILQETLVRSLKSAQVSRLEKCRVVLSMSNLEPVTFLFKEAGGANPI